MCRWHRVPHVDLVLPVDDREEAREPPDALRRAELQEAAGLQGVVEDRHDALLQRRTEIDEHVAATDEVDLRERWVSREILRREDADVTDRPADLIASVRLEEEPLQPIARDLVLDTGGKRPGPRPSDGRAAEVGAEYLHRDGAAGPAEELEQADRERVGLLARGAAWHPDPDGLVSGTSRHEARCRRPGRCSPLAGSTNRRPAGRRACRCRAQSRTRVVTPRFADELFVPSARREHGNTTAHRPINSLDTIEAIGVSTGSARSAHSSVSLALLHMTHVAKARRRGRFGRTESS